MRHRMEEVLDKNRDPVQYGKMVGQNQKMIQGSVGMKKLRQIYGKKKNIHCDGDVHYAHVLEQLQLVLEQLIYKCN